MSTTLVATKGKESLCLGDPSNFIYNDYFGINLDVIQESIKDYESEMVELFKLHIISKIKTLLLEIIINNKIEDIDNDIDYIIEQCNDLYGVTGRLYMLSTLLEDGWELIVE